MREVHQKAEAEKGGCGPFLNGFKPVCSPLVICRPFSLSLDHTIGPRGPIQIQKFPCTPFHLISPPLQRQDIPQKPVLQGLFSVF